MHSSPVSPPPFMVGMAEIELDRETGVVEVLNYAAVVDCGIPINPALARIQVEGGIVQGIGHTLMEDVTRTPKGAIRESSLFTYVCPPVWTRGASAWSSSIPMSPRVRSARSLSARSSSTRRLPRSRRQSTGNGRVASRAAYSAGAYPARETGGELARRGLGQGLGRRSRLPTRPLLRDRGLRQGSG